MSFEQMLTDTVSLVKPNGQRVDNINASVQPGQIFIHDTSIQAEEGDTILRQLPNGQIEAFTILDTGYRAGLGPIPPHYQMRVQKQTHVSPPAATTPLVAQLVRYVADSRLAELRAVNSNRFDLSRLIRLCEETNIAYANGCFFATAMLARAILDHVPPVFGCSSFAEVANNYRGSRSFAESMRNLDNSSRKIADSCLHQQIRKTESLPNETQVNFASSLDMLLAEVARILK